MVRLNDDANLTPSDFAIDIPVLPYQLKDGHKQYQDPSRTQTLMWSVWCVRLDKQATCRLPTTSHSRLRR